MLETRSQKDSRKRTRWIWRKKRTESTDTDHDEPEQIQSKLPKISMMTKTKIDIPNDIVIEILSRLPGKSLLQFKWACKYWYDLITKDSSFAKLQLVNYAINNPLLMFSSSTYSKKYASLILSSLSYTKLVEVDRGLIDEGSSSSSLSLLPSVTGLFKSQSKSNGTIVVSSCNGLFCISKQTWDDPVDHFCIWNPCTNEFKESIPQPMVEFPEGMQGRYFFYGFGYDQTIDDYKVISNTILRMGDSYATVVQVYTLGTNSWKTIGFYHPFRLCSRIKFFHNVASFYCIGRKSSGSFLDVILCFDIAKEEYREISKPWFVRDDLLRVQLIELNGCLCIAQKDVYSPGVDVWMVKDYYHDDLNKNEYSWTKLYTIRQPDIVRSFGFKSLGIFNKNNGGEIILLSEQNLVWYNEKDNKICKTISLEVCGSVSKVIAYVENLVSLNSGTYVRLVEEEEQAITRGNHQQEKFSSYEFV